MDRSMGITVDGSGVDAAASDLEHLGTSLVIEDKTADFSIAVPQAVDSQAAYTISLWVKSTDDAPGAKTALLQFAGQGRTLLYQRADGEFVSFVAGADGGGDIALGTDPARGTWEHLTVVKTGNPKAIKLYINGKKLDQGSWKGNLPSGMMDLIIGEHKNPGDMARFEGMLDEVCIFRRALTDAEVGELYGSYGDLTVADELARLIKEATDLYAGLGDSKDQQSATQLKTALDRAASAQASGNLQDMKAAHAELEAAMRAVREQGPTVRIDAAKAKRALSNSLFGINHRYSNYAYGTVNPDGTVKDDFAALYQQAGFGSLRYPGGTISNNYVWKESIGDLDPATKEIERTPQIHGFYNNPGQTGFTPTFGLLEVAEFAERMNSEIIMVYGIGRGDADDAADLVEFLNARQGTNPNGGVAWADRRAELGHPEPFGIRYFEIGNENNQGGNDGTASQQYWMTGVAGGALEGYTDGGLATFTGQYAVVRGDWNEDKSYSTGEAGQEFACRYALVPREREDATARDAVVSGSVKVYVDGELWSPVDDLSTAAASDTVYQLDMATGFFTFGDGAHGAIPARGSQITVDYQVERDGFIDISRAMRKTMAQIDPAFEQNGTLNIYTSWEGDEFVDLMHRKGADDLYDGMAVHPYTNKVGNPAHNNNAPTVADKQAWYLDVMRLGDGVADTVQHHVDHMRQVTGDATKVPVISEYGIFRSTNSLVRSQAHALYIARAIMEYAEQGSPYIQKHCLVDYYSSGADSLGPTQQAVIQAVAQGNLDGQKDGSGEFKFFATPSAHVFSMLNSSFGDTEVATEVSNEAVLSNGVNQHAVMASTDADGTVYVALVNLALNDVEGAGTDGDLPSTVTLSVDGVDLTGRELEVKSLSGKAFYAENSLDDPNAVAVETRTETASGRTHTLKLAPHSFTVVTIKASGGEQPPVDPAPQPDPDPEPPVDPALPVDPTPQPQPQPEPGHPSSGNGTTGAASQEPSGEGASGAGRHQGALPKTGDASVALAVVAAASSVVCFACARRRAH